MPAFITEHAYLIAQIFGFTAMGAAILTYQFNKQRTVNLLLMGVATLWSLHYAALGLMTPILMNVVNVVRAAVYARRDKKYFGGRYVPVIFCVASAVLCAVGWENAWSLLPGAASVFASVANWQTDTKKLRLLTVPVCLCWLTYNIANRSIAGLCNEAFTLVSIGAAFLRYDVKKKRDT